MKRPSFQFYPSDWLRDTALRSCSTGARGLWMDMICFMHEGKPYGHLKVGDKVILPFNLARMVGETLEVVEGWLFELSQAGVYEINEEGAIYSKRMIRDENLRQIRAAGGSKGGNPLLKDKGKVNLEDKQKTTPSSASSSSSSINTLSKDSGDKSPMSTNEIIFTYGVPLLTNAGVADKQARSFLGGLRKSHGDDALVDALRECLKAKPLQPLEWLAAVLPPKGSAPKLNKQETLEANNRAVVERMLKKEGLV